MKMEISFKQANVSEANKIRTKTFRMQITTPIKKVS